MVSCAARGDLIAGAFVAPAGEPLRSRNPARDGAVVFETAADPTRIGLACEAAAAALPGWMALGREGRSEALRRFRAALAARGDALADALVLETGKIRSEARAEAAALVSRFDAVRAQAAAQLREGPLPGRPTEELRWHALGVVGVIGPFNYPLHLCHAHALPALLLGNTVVVKPSEVTPLCGQRYAEAAEEAGLPAGVLNLVQGGGASGAALTTDPHLRGLCFTGSWATGRRIRQALVDRPEVLLALEMGGKNAAVVMADADLRQAAHEVLLGAFLTAGQRCTCTDRVLVDSRVEDRLVAILRKLAPALRMGDPEDPASFAGPLSTEGGRERFEAALRAAEEAGAEPVLPGERLPGGFYRSPSIHRLPRAVHQVPGFTDTELFGPGLGLESFEGEDEAVALLGAGPCGLVHSVFTASEAGFERIYRAVPTGILNRNRATNQASPRLPFGGVGRSGNHRPAGSFAVRNAVYPVALQSRVHGEVHAHPALAPSLPPPDLDRLELRHQQEEASAAARHTVLLGRPRQVVLPEGGRLPASEAWLARLYSGGRMPMEKKPTVFDHARASGPWLVSIDDPPMAVLDGMSQTATHPAGFSADAVARAWCEGAFGDTPLRCADTTLGPPGDPGAPDPHAGAFASTLRSLLPGLPQVSFTSSGAEANEKALALCRLHAGRPEATRILAFEGSFHGRTLLALHATWSPKKREPFEIAGYEAAFAPFPVWPEPGAPEPEAPAGYLQGAAAGDLEALRRLAARGSSDLLVAEVESLGRVHELLGSGAFFACIIEPMQSEGGDRYASARFFRALRLLTRFHGTPLIFDEVQTGFGLGGRFAWHRGFGLVRADGGADTPDAVTFAKRAQVGVCVSRFPDSEPGAAHTASLVRGRLHAEICAEDPVVVALGARAMERLRDMARRFPELVGGPRGQGYALAFDLPSAAHLAAYLRQRFWRGAVVFGAGVRTVRYRLSAAYGEVELDRLFESIRRSLAWLEAHPGCTPPAWEDLPATPKVFPRPPAALPGRLRVRVAEPREAEALLPRILDLEARVYEPARRDPPDRLRLAFDLPEGVAVVAERREDRGWELVGCALGVPLESVAGVPGPDRDPMLGRGNTFYSTAVTIEPGARGHGLGRKLKEVQLRRARELQDAAGRPRYRFATGRNRVGQTAAMDRINRALGAHEVLVLDEQYGEAGAQALYYRIPLHDGGAPLGDVDPPAHPAPPARPAPPASPALDLATGLACPFDTPPEGLRRAMEAGSLCGPTVTKITLCNYVTPAVVRAVEWVGALLPGLPHLYLTSGRDETVDKALRTVRWHRPTASVALGLEGGYLGHTTAAARSLSDPAVHRQGPPVFDWPRLPHPARIGAEAFGRAVREAAAAAGGPERLFGLFLEAVQERTGRVLPGDLGPVLADLRAELDLPIVLCETASACYRSARGPFAFGEALRPDLVLWWAGGQVGFVHLGPRWFVPVPLTMVSTWDGDELSLVRLHHQLRAARELALSQASAVLDGALEPATAADLPVEGLGLYRVAQAGDRSESLREDLLARGLRPRALPGGRLVFAPALDRAQEAAERLGEALAEILR